MASECSQSVCELVLDRRRAGGPSFDAPLCVIGQLVPRNVLDESYLMITGLKFHVL